jgi:hypothetical protein
MMSKFFQSRRLVALAAAYVVALQALLLPLSVAAGGAFDASLCTAAASVDGSPPPAGHDTGCPCAAGCGTQCCVQTLAGPPPVMIALGLMRAIAVTPAPAIAPASRPTDRNPQIPRAPPTA